MSAFLHSGVQLGTSGAGGLAPGQARCSCPALLLEWDIFSRTGKGLRNPSARSKAKGGLFVFFPCCEIASILGLCISEP